jgi:DsbC/DsbD-like thiol-disulfide interchange protein
MMMARLLLSIVFVAAGFLQVQAQSTVDKVLSHRIIPGWTQADGTRLAALELTLAPGWKTYWRAPGDAGIPPDFTWRGARNLSAVHVHWPAPVVFWQSGMRSVGYEDRVVLPLSVVPQDAAEEVQLKGRVDLGICSDICVPASIDIDATIPATQQGRSPAVVAALAALPLSAREAGVTRTVCRLTPTASGLRVEAQVTVPSIGGNEEAVIEPPSPGIWVSEAVADRAGDDLIVSAELIAQGGGPLFIDRSRLRFTLIGNRGAVDIRGCTG